MSDDNSSTRKPHNYFEESTPAQREESAKISAAKAEVERIKEIGDAQKTFGKVEKTKLNFDYGNGNSRKKQQSNNEREEKSRERNDKKTHFVQKHSEPSLLAEAVIVGGIPYFAVSRLNSGDIKITLEESIPITDKSEVQTP